MVLEWPLDVAGQFFLEVFCGDAVFTMGVMLAKIPCICPWDVKYGEQFDVLQHGPVLLALAEAHRISSAHLGTPCQSLTWCRLPVLRTWQHIQGRPSLLQREQELVSNGNELVLFTGTFILALYKVAYIKQRLIFSGKSCTYLVLGH